MNGTTTTVIVALAAVVFIGAGLAAGAGVAAANPTESIGTDETSSVTDAAADPGPPGDLPDPVPEFVGGLLETITQFLSGVLGAFGDAASDVAGGAMGGS